MGTRENKIVQNTCVFTISVEFSLFQRGIVFGVITDG